MEITSQNVQRSLPEMTDAQLYGFHRKLQGMPVRDEHQEKMYVVISHEINERTEDTTKQELDNTSSDDIVEFLRNIGTGKRNRVDSIRYSVALEMLIDRHPGEAKRADLFTERNEFISWDTTFFALVTDIEFGRRV